MISRIFVAGCALAASCSLSALMPTVVLAQETENYSYDALGRLVTVKHVGGLNAAVESEIQYDPAGNRINYKVSGSSNSLPPMKFIVAPINGFTIIPIPQ